jgi:hypothetical protein
MDNKYNDFPKTTNKERWVKYLNRPLDNNEISLLEELKKETMINNMIIKLNNVLKERENNKLKISLLTNIDGNCLFESLVYHGIGNSIKSLRIGLGYLMYQLQDCYLPNQNNTIKEIYDSFFCDDISFVYCNKEKKIYNYDYNLMCKDIVSYNSWNRLPTNLIMVVMSWIFNIRIIIISDNTNYENIINAYDNIKNKENPKLRDIYLGKIGGEFHYFPLNIIDNINNQKELKYREIKNIFIKWGRYMSKNKNVS